MSEKNGQVDPSYRVSRFLALLTSRRIPMPRAQKEPPAPFVPVADPQEVLSDPVNSRVLQLFDGLRRRGVGPERAAYVVANVHSASSNNAHPSSGGAR